MLKANWAGWATLSITAKPAYIPRKAGLFARGEIPVLVLHAVGNCILSF